ncbi:MAG: excinuclease ABC subunit UvrC [Anaerolineae bacterium]
MIDRLHLQERLGSIPTKPGVYLMKDKEGKILYVGKAVNLRSRVRSYFHASTSHNPKVQRLVDSLADLDFIVTGSELEALILECNLIKRYRPRYNVRLRDDKRYPYIKVTWQENFPKVMTTRRMQRDGSRYFGPFTASWAVHQTLHTLRKVFPYLTCNRVITGADRRACLYYDIGLCLGPCIGTVSREEYRRMVEQLCSFLQGEHEEIVEDLRTRMEKAAESLQFESAASLRDKLQAIERVIERQKIVSTTMSDHDVIALAREDGQACVQVFFIRRGKLIGREYFLLEGTEDEETREIMASFVKQFYDEAAYVPAEILLQEDIDEALIIESWLKEKRGTKVAIKIPRRGTKKELVEMAAQNATETLAALKMQWLAEERVHVTALTELQEALGLDGPPTRIESYDVSNIQGQAASGSMVVFVKGVPRKSEYRRFKIRSVEGVDDYAMLQEVLRRRLARAEEEPTAPGKTNTWAIMPDLLIVDGGKGQLNAALGVLEEYGLKETIPIASLAKEREEVYLPGRTKPLRLPRDSQALYLLQRLRDEAHRFAVGYHRHLRRRDSLASALDDIPGIGPKRRQTLLRHFGTVARIREASLEELAALEGMNRWAAAQVKEHL